MEPPFTFGARKRFILCGREIFPGDRVSVYPGYGIFPVLGVPPDYGAVAGALADDSLEPLTPSLSPQSFAQAVGLESASGRGTSPPRSDRVWGRRLRRERAGLAILP